MSQQKNLPQSMIAQSYIGQVSVVGECFCYGVALDGQQVVYLDIAGSATSVEAVWAKLAQAKECYLIPPSNADKIVLRSDKEKLKRLERKVEGVGVYHLLLVHRDIIEPTYAELSTTYLFLTNDKAQITAKLGAHIAELVDIAVFPAWFNYLVQQGRVAGLLQPLSCHGGVQIWRVALDKTAWERLICQGLAQGKICLPR